MNRVLRNRSVRKKLTVIGLLTNGVALVLAFIGFMVHQLVVFQRSSMDDHASTARILSEHCAPALAGNDVDAAAKQLRAVAVNPHIAAAVQTPAVVIFGSSNINHWRPWTDAPYEVVSEKLPCQPCAGYFCKEFGEPECIKRIAVESVFRGIEKILFAK